MRSCFQSSFLELRSSVSEKESKIYQPIRGQQGHLVFLIGPKNTNLVEDIEILLPVKFRWIPFSNFRGEVENVSANQRQGWPSCFFNQPQKHKIGRTLRSYFLSKVLHFGPAPPPGACDVSEVWETLDELAVQVWLLYDHPNFKYCTLFISGTELRTDDPNTRCPQRCFQAGGIKMWKVNYGRTTDNAWSQHLSLRLRRNKNRCSRNTS